MFTCRVCNGDKYDEVFGGVFKCTTCSVIFADPDTFSLSNCKSVDGEVAECGDGEDSYKPIMGERGPLHFVKQTTIIPRKDGVGSVKRF